MLCLDVVLLETLLKTQKQYLILLSLYCHNTVYINIVLMFHQNSLHISPARSCHCFCLSLTHK